MLARCPPGCTVDARWREGAGGTVTVGTPRPRVTLSRRAATTTTASRPPVWTVRTLEAGSEHRTVDLRAIPAALEREAGAGFARFEPDSPETRQEDSDKKKKRTRGSESEKKKKKPRTAPAPVLSLSLSLFSEMTHTHRRGERRCCARCSSSWCTTSRTSRWCAS